MGKEYTEAQRRATDKYQKKLSSISIRIKEEEANRYKQAAKKCNMSLREFVLKSMDEKIENANLGE